MSAQSDSIKTDSDEWRVRAALKPKERYTVEDFPVGRLIVGESRRGWRTGRIGLALCEVIDAYAHKSARYNSDGLVIHAKVIASSDDYLGYMIGHVAGLHIASPGSFYSDTDLRVTTISPKTMLDGKAA